MGSGEESMSLGSRPLARRAFLARRLATRVGAGWVPLTAAVMAPLMAPLTGPSDRVARAGSSDSSRVTRPSAFSAAKMPCRVASSPSRRTGSRAMASPARRASSS